MDSGKKAMFETYFNTHYSNVFHFVQQRISNHHDAEDLVMDAFCTCYQKLDTFDPEKASFGTWFYVIVSNKLKNYYRDHKIYEDIDDCIIPTDSFEDSLLAADYLTEMRTALAEALQFLSVTQRSIIILHFFKKKSSGEIADVLDLSAGNVRVMQNRAIKKIRDYFEEKQIRWEIV